MMKTVSRILAAALVLALFAAPAIGQSGYYYFFQVQNEYGEPFTTDGFANCSVYQYATNGSISPIVHSAGTLAQGTGLAGPLYSNTNGIIHWYSSTTDPVDVVCYTKGGDSGRMVRMARTKHSLRINTSGADKVVRFPFSSQSTPASTGIYIPEGAVILGAAVQVVTSPAGGSGHINVGLNGNHAAAAWNAIVSGMPLSTRNDASAASAGFRTYAFPIGTSTPPGVSHLGLLLRHAVGGSAAGGDPINYIYNGGYMVHVTGGMELTYTATPAPAGGHAFVFFRVLHTGSLVNGTGF